MIARLACLWAGLCVQDQPGAVRQRVRHYLERYYKEEEVRQYFDGLVSSAGDFSQLVEIIKDQPEFFVGER